MKIIKTFEAFMDDYGDVHDIGTMVIPEEFDKLIDLLNSVISDYQVFDEQLILTIKSGMDKSDECPDEIEFEVSYNKENDSYILFRTLDEYYMGEYELKEASDMIKFSYREF